MVFIEILLLLLLLLFLLHGASESFITKKGTLNSEDLVLWIRIHNRASLDKRGIDFEPNLRQ